jgi:Zn-dependent protease
MKYRIALWAATGFLVAGFWALLAFATSPSTNEWMRDGWTLVSLTCPVAIAGRHYPIGLFEALAANAAAYALIGLIVETLRQQLRHPK